MSLLQTLPAMRICKIWDADYPWDIRVEKVISALTAVGWRVDLVCRNEKRLPRVERLGNLEIHRLPSMPAAFGRLNRLINFPYFFNPVWIETIRRVAKQNRPDVILVRDLPLAVTGIAIGRRLGIPIVLDMAENYPAMLRDIWRFGRFKTSNILVRNPKFAEWVERYVITHVDHIFVVVDESALRLVRLGVPPTKISVVGNTPPQTRTEDISPMTQSAELPAGDPLIMYLGNLDVGRGVDTLIAAMPFVLEMAPQAHLVIIGTGTESDRLRSQAIRLRIQRAISLLGRIPYTVTRSYLAHADICVVPHDATDANNTTISNKLFDYMAAGIPVVVSDCPPTARIVRSVGCGLEFPSRDPFALAQRIGQLLKRSDRDRMGQKARDAIRGQFNWERDSRVLIRALSEVRKRTPGCPERVRTRQYEKRVRRSDDRTEKINQ